MKTDLKASVSGSGLLRRVALATRTGQIAFVVAGLVLVTGTRAASPSEVLPASDPGNKGGWVLNTTVSDEFEGRRLDESKWLIQGTDGEYRANFIGRAPSQFSTKNVRLEGGMMKLQSRWDPNFDFSEKIDRTDKSAKNGRKYENITTAAVISKAQVRYGYFEIRCKAAAASVTSSFWMTGRGTEIDVFEFSGRPKQRRKIHLESELWSSIHDWSKPGGPTTWTDRLQLGWKVADGFHVYAMEWDPEYLKFYADGKLIREVSKSDVGEEGWVINQPVWVWVDSEIFPWHGIPEKKDLPVDYEIDYIRVWQKPSQLSGAGNILGFEEPANGGPDWWVPRNSRSHLSIVDERAAAGDRSLKYVNGGAIPDKVMAFSPFGSVAVEGGKQTVSLRVYPEKESPLKRIRLMLENPRVKLKPFELEGLPANEWTTLTQTVRRRRPSGAKDRVRVVVEADDVRNSDGALYLDDLKVETR